MWFEPLRPRMHAEASSRVSRSPGRARRSACAACLSLLVLANYASAQSKPALTGRESIDLVPGPVLGSGRVVGLGGAYAALAVGADGAAWTPAAYATRVLWDLNWFA